MEQKLDPFIADFLRFLIFLLCCEGSGAEQSEVGHGPLALVRPRLLYLLSCISRNKP